jgi:hypothetical protein
VHRQRWFNLRLLAEFCVQFTVRIVIIVSLFLSVTALMTITPEPTSALNMLASLLSTLSMTFLTMLMAMNFVSLVDFIAHALAGEPPGDIADADLAAPRAIFRDEILREQQHVSAQLPHIPSSSDIPIVNIQMSAQPAVLGA